ncbi:MAG: zf-HC2 domain-containing protein [Planctomycetes bacterium]|nr:zf-HC2 domain-containing protein [Planctomycetota bacterium]
MDCDEVSQKLQLLADGELSREECALLERHLDECLRVRKCENCRKVIRGMRRLKEIIASAQKSEMPSSLEGMVREMLARRRRGRWTRRAVLLAGVIALAAAIGLSAYFSRENLAHAEIVELCFAEYDKVCRESSGAERIGLEPYTLRQILEDVKRIAGIDLDGLPLLKKAQYCGCESWHLARAAAVRIDFWPSSDCACARPHHHRISIFVLPLSRVSDREELLRGRENGKPAYARCGQGKSNTIYCLVGSRHLFNLVTRHELPVVEELEPVYTPASGM